MKKICFIAQFPPPMHGLSKAVDTLSRSELSREFDFEKIDIADNKKILGNLLAIRRSRADLFYFTISQSRGGNLRDLLIFRAIGARPCLIHLHGGYYRTLIDHDMPGWQRKMNYKAISKLSGAIVLGPSLRRIFEGMLPDEKIFTVQNCVDDEFLMSDEEFAEKVASLPERKIKHVLYLSNFIRSKGYPEVLEMAKLEKERVASGGVRRFHFDFAGKFFEKREEVFFEGFIKKHRLEDYVTCHGVVGGDKKRELLKLCDVFVLLTTYPKEGQPISILEAMGNGMVIVTTNHAGIPDLVADRENGIMSDRSSICPSMICRRLLDSSDSVLGDIVRRNRRKVKNEFMQAGYVEKMRDLFHLVSSDGLSV